MGYQGKPGKTGEWLVRVNKYRFVLYSLQEVATMGCASRREED